MIHALVPAAGNSSRMGCPKLLLPLGKQTVIELVIQTLRWASIEEILVVVPPTLPELTVRVRGAGAQVLELSEPTSHMRQTVEHGLAWIEERWSPQPADSVLLVPADHPALDVGVVGRLLAARARQHGPTIFVPTYDEARGHPVLFDWLHVEGIRSAPADEGVNRYLRSRWQETQEVRMNKPSVLWDLDTPEDYERIKGLFEPEQLPGDEKPDESV